MKYFCYLITFILVLNLNAHADSPLEFSSFSTVLEMYKDRYEDLKNLDLSSDRVELENRIVVMSFLNSSLVRSNYSVSIGFDDLELSDRRRRNDFSDSHTMVTLDNFVRFIRGQNPGFYLNSYSYIVTVNDQRCELVVTISGSRNPLEVNYLRAVRPVLDNCSIEGIHSYMENFQNPIFQINNIEHVLDIMSDDL